MKAQYKTIHNLDIVFANCKENMRTVNSYIEITNERVRSGTPLKLTRSLARESKAVSSTTNSVNLLVMITAPDSGRLIKQFRFITITI